MFIDNFSSAEELIDTRFLLEKHLKLMEKRIELQKANMELKTL